MDFQRIPADDAGLPDQIASVGGLWAGRDGGMLPPYDLDQHIQVPVTK